MHVQLYEQGFLLVNYLSAHMHVVHRTVSYLTYLSACLHVAHRLQCAEQDCHPQVLHQRYALLQRFNVTLHTRFRLCFYCAVYSTTCSTEIKTHISKCKAGWTGNFCHEACPNKLLAGEYYSGNKHSHSCQVSRCTNAKRGEYFTGSGTDGRTSCPTAPCTNKLNVGEYYAESGTNAVCAVAQCTNAKNGQYYTGRGLSGRTSCPTAPCTNKPKAGLRFITNGGTSSTGCKIGGVYALSSALIYLLLTHACTTQFLREITVTILLCRPKILQRRRMDEDSGQSQHGHGVCSMQQRAVSCGGTHQQ